MVRLMTDPGQLLLGTVDGALRHMDLRWYPETVISVVLAARGYPGTYRRGSEIRGLEAAAAVDGVTLFHAGTRILDDGRVLADGGRVLNVVASGTDAGQARARARAALARIDWPDGFWRGDIGALDDAG